MTPEVVRWWGDPAEQYALLEEDLGNPLMVMRIVAFDTQPFAYVQDYDVHTWPQAHFAHLPEGARSIDAFIGVPDMVGRGHGAAFLRERAGQLISHQPEKCVGAADVSSGAPLAVFASADARKIAGAPVVAIDPDAANLRARAAYAKAGFIGDTIVATAAGPVVVMVFGGASPDR
jgi:aminoglycoside 6'-N-acetyltransferase